MDVLKSGNLQKQGTLLNWKSFFVELRPDMITFYKALSGTNRRTTAASPKQELFLHPSLRGSWLTRQRSLFRDARRPFIACTVFNLSMQWSVITQIVQSSSRW